MSVIYENTTLSGVSNSAMEMGDIEPPKETDYKTQEDEYETLQFEHNTPQCQTEPARMDRMGPTKCSVSRKATLLQCSVVILISLAVSTISGVVVNKLTKEDIKDMQLEIQSRLSSASSSALSNQSESFQDQITLFEKKMRQNVLILKQQMQDNVTVLEQQMKDNVTLLEQKVKDNVTVLEQQMKDNVTVLKQQIKDDVTVLERQMKDNDTVLEQQIKDNVIGLKQQIKDNVTVLEQQMIDNVTVLEQQVKHNDTVLEQQMKDSDLKLAKQTENDINNLKENMSSNITILNNKLDGVESEQSQLADRFENRSTSIAAFTATQPAYSGRSSFINYYTLNFSRTIYNLGGDFNSSTGLFTCTKPGTYYFSVFLVKKGSLYNRIDRVYCSLYKNRSYIIQTLVDPTDDDTDIGSAQAANSVVIHLNTGDVVYLLGCTSVSYMEPWSSFSGFLLYPDA